MASLLRDNGLAFRIQRHCSKRITGRRRANNCGRGSWFLRRLHVSSPARLWPIIDCIGRALALPNSNERVSELECRADSRLALWGLACGMLGNLSPCCLLVEFSGVSSLPDPAHVCDRSSTIRTVLRFPRPLSCD